MNPMPSSPAYDTALAAHDGSWLQEIMPSVTRRTSSTRAVQGFSAGSSHRTGGSSEAPDSGRVLCFFSQLHATRSSFGNGAVTCAMAISQQLAKLPYRFSCVSFCLALRAAVVGPSISNAFSAHHRTCSLRWSKYLRIALSYSAEPEILKSEATAEK